MQLTVLGLNHRTAPVEIRERFNFSNDRVASILRRLRNYDNIPEAMLLSTCNRTELYMVIENPHEAIPFIKSLLKHLAGEHYQSEYFYNLNGTNCVKHLFRVASSLDSLIVGEGQILSQIKNAYHIARINGMTDTILNTIMNKAIAVGKRVRTETKIAYSSVSVSSAAVELAIKILGDLSKAQILVVGAGHMSELTAQHLLDKGAQTICVSNRHYERAQDLADKFHGTAIPYRAMFEHAADADIIITSTGAPHYVLTAENLGPLLPKRNGRPLILIDIAVPRDVDPRLADVDGVTIYNIDDLEGVVDTNKNFREKEAHVAVQIGAVAWVACGKACVEAFLPWYAGMTQVPEGYGRHTTPSEAYSLHFKDVTEMQKNYPAHFYWNFTERWRSIAKDYPANAPGEIEKRNNFQQILFKRQQGFEKRMMQMLGGAGGLQSLTKELNSYTARAYRDYMAIID